MEYQKHIYVLDSEDHPICAVNGLQYDSDNYTDNFLGISELTFTVNRYIWIQYPNPQLIESTGYEYLMEGMSLYITDIGIFKITDVSRSDDSYAEIKEITCSSCEIELQNRDAVTFYVNTGITGSKEMMAEGNLSDAGLPMESVLIYNEKNQQLSFLDLILDECPDWSVGYVDPLLLTKAVLPMEIESQNVYSVLMEEFSQNNKVVVTFDYKHRKVNCYSHERINIINDTNIFIRYENLANSVDIKRHNEGIYTRFNVAGADGMEISQINLGESRIEDLRWIVSQKSKSGRHIYVTNDLSEKYINWYNTREDLRKQYAEKSKSYNQYIIDINELQTKDCMDALKIDLGTYSDEELSGLKESYILTCNVLCVDYSVRDEKGNQVLDDEGYAEISDMDSFKESPYYADYKIYKETLIPNIEIEQENRIINNRSDLTASEKKNLYKNTLDDWETDWSLYGIDSLETKLKVYESNINILKEKNYQLTWDELSDSQKIGFNSIDWSGQHEIYLENVNNYNGCLVALTELKEKKNCS